MKKQNYQQNQTPERNAETLALVKKAQQGDEKSLNELYTRYEWFLFKYRQMFRSEIDMLRLVRSYSDVASFFSLYVGKRTKNIISNNQANERASNVAFKKANELVELGKEIGGQEDVNSIIDLTFFQCVKRYDPDAKVISELKKLGLDYTSMKKKEQKKYQEQFPVVSFEGFLLTYFKFRLKKNLDVESRGIIPGIGWCKPYGDNETGVNTTEEATETDQEAITVCIDHDNIETIIAQLQNIDHDWVEGTTATWPFDQLSKQERWLIKARFVDRQYTYVIAENIGMSTSIIRARVADIRIKLLKLNSIEH
jgi:hypothetical protein